MEHPTTKSVILSILSLPDGPPLSSFVHDALNVVRGAGRNPYDYLLRRSVARLPVIQDDIREDIQNTLQDCLVHWNIGERRKTFKTIMEEHVPRID